jgi:hypothetical protein
MPGPYELGQLVSLSATFRTGGTVEDPTTVTMTLKKANQPLQTFVFGASNIERLSKGVYRLAVTSDVPGVWKYRWIGTGLVETSAKNQFIVNRTS